MKAFLIFLFLPLLAWGEEAKSPFDAPSTISVDAMNSAAGIPLWNAETPVLWDEDATAVAERLHWPLESKTATQSSFRLYPSADMTIFGARPYSIALYGQDGKVDRLSIVFMNQGDYEGFRGGAPASSAVQAQFDNAIRKDGDQIAAKLSALLGSPHYEDFGNANLQEKVRRWDWNGQSILLVVAKDHYVALRIVTTAVADHFGRGETGATQALREALVGRVIQRRNGDVVISQIPMVDQGPKGYCEPATWERYLRSLGIPADMYILAMAGGTQEGGGTRTSEMVEAASELVRSHGLIIEQERATLTMSAISFSIDQGLPLMWECFCPADLEKKLFQRAHDRIAVYKDPQGDWSAYAAGLQEARTAASAYKNDPDRMRTGHMRMIIGYNRQTEEFAISDSWGRPGVERWITPEEAEAVSRDSIYQIKW